MGELVWAACASHAGGQLRVRRDAVDQDRIDRVYDGWAQLASSLRTAAPDALVVVGTDHMYTFSDDLMPIFTIGRGETFETWGELGNTIRTIRGVPEVSDAVHRGLVQAGFDVAGMVGMRLDHAYACPLELIDPDNELKVVPLSVNCFAPPLPTFARARQLGVALRRVIQQSEVGRIAALGTGGISHWVGVPETGRINPDWDRSVLGLFEAADVEALEEMDSGEWLQEGGPGAGELLCWMVAFGAAGSAGARRLVYEPVKAWITGTSLMEVAVT